MTESLSHLSIVDVAQHPLASKTFPFGPCSARGLVLHPAANRSAGVCTPARGKGQRRRGPAWFPWQQRSSTRGECALSQPLSAHACPLRPNCSTHRHPRWESPHHALEPSCHYKLIQAYVSAVIYKIISYNSLLLSYDG